MWQYIFLYLLLNNTTFTNIIYQRRHGIKVNKVYDAGVTYKNNKNVDIKFSAHDAFLEQLSSIALIMKRLECQIITKNYLEDRTPERT